MTMRAEILDLAKAELKAAHICRRWPNRIRSKQYQLRAIALYLLCRKARAVGENGDKS